MVKLLNIQFCPILQFDDPNQYSRSVGTRERGHITDTIINNDKINQSVKLLVHYYYQDEY